MPELQGVGAKYGTSINATVSMGDIEVMELLQVARGAELNKPFPGGTGLSGAALCGQLGAVQVLLDHGADT